MTATSVEADGNYYSISALTLDQAEQILDRSIPPQTQVRRLVMTCLNNAGAQYDEQSIGAMPFPIYSKIRDAALELNGLKPTGEAAAAATA